MCYEFQDWPGGSIATTAGAWIVTRELANELRRNDITGVRYAGDVVVTRDPQWEEFEPEVELPEWEWIVPVGTVGVSDFWLRDIATLAVSEHALRIIKDVGLGDGWMYSIDEYPNGPPRMNVSETLAELERRRKRRDE